MDRNIFKVLIITLTILVTIMVLITLIINPLFTPLKELSKTDLSYNTSTAKPLEITSLNISLIDTKFIKYLRPIEYYRLSNGTVIKVKHYNPFPFSISITKNITFRIPYSKLTVYKVRFAETVSDVIKVANTLGIDIRILKFNEVTKTYLYRNSSLRFEYTPTYGFFRIIFEEPTNVNTQSFINKIKSIVDEKLVYRLKTLRAPSKFLGSVPIEYSTIYVGVLNEVLTPFKIVLKYDNEGKIIEIEGSLPLEINTIMEYYLIPVNALTSLLSERISGRVQVSDWYISKLGFTKLIITNLSLTYRLTSSNLLVPVYIFQGKWFLNYGGIHDSGKLKGFIIAINLTK